MSRIYHALKNLEAERQGAAASSGGNGGGNGHGGRPQAARRRGWQHVLQRLVAPGGRVRRSAGSSPVNFDMGPEAEEAYHRLGTNLLAGPLAEPELGSKLVGLVAARHGEGTTTTAAMFASILVRRRGGRVGAVEVNFRSPSFETAFGIGRNGGFADLVRGQHPLAAVAQPTAVPNLLAIGCGQLEGPAPALFDSPGLPTALEQLRASFDFVIFDLPPVNLYGDALIFGPRLDAAIIVIEADATRVSEVERARRMLERSGVRTVGSVLNRRRTHIPAFLEEML